MLSSVIRYHEEADGEGKWAKIGRDGKPQRQRSSNTETIHILTQDQEQYGSREAR